MQCLHKPSATACFHSLSSAKVPSAPNEQPESRQLVLYRKQSTEVASTSSNKPKPYSPFQVDTSNKAEFALARIDDLVNFARKVSTSTILIRIGPFRCNDFSANNCKKCVTSRCILAATARMLDYQSVAATCL